MSFGLRVVLSARDRFSPVLTRVGAGLGRLRARSEALGPSMRKWGTIGVGSATAITVALGSTVKTYQELAQAQGEVESLGVNSKGIDTITKSALKFSNTFSGTTAPEFVKASYDIKSGIASLSSGGVASFTRLAALIGKATKSSTTQMTSFFATGYGIYGKQFNTLQSKTVRGWKKLSQEEKDIKFGETFAAGIAGAVQMFKTDGMQMQGAIEGLGAQATASNVPLSEQLAILGSMQESFASGSEAATAYKGFLSGAFGAQKGLKLNFLDKNKQLLSAPKILEKLHKKFGNTLDASEKSKIYKNFGGEEGLKFILTFYNKIEKLKHSIGGMKEKLKSGTKSVEKMALATNKGHEFEILSQRTSNLTTIIGQQFAPMVIKASNAIGSTILKLQTWSKQNPKTVATITKVVTIGTGLIATLGGISLAMGTLTLAFTPIVALFSPVYLGIALIAGAGYLLYDNWTLVSKFWGGLWTDMANDVSNWGGQIQTYWGASLTNMSNYIINWESQIQTYWTSMWTNTKTTFNNGLTYIKEIFNWNPLDTITKVWDKAFAYMDNKFTALKDKLNIFKNFSIGSIFGKDKNEKKQTTQTNLGDTIKKMAISPIIATQLVTAQPNIPNPKDRSFKTVEKLVLAPIPKAKDRSFTTQKNISPFTSMKDRLFKTKEPKHRNNPTPKLGTLNTTTKKILKQSIKVEAPIHITVNSVQGKVDTAGIGNIVSRGVTDATKKAVAVNGFEDKE